MRFVPAVPFPLPEPKALQASVAALKEGLEVLSGQRGTPDNRALTVQDLVDLGLITTDQATAWLRSS
jgi:hypothetical protein